MTVTIDLGDLSARDIGRHVSIERMGAIITGRLTDFQVHTDWIAETRLGQNPDDAEQVPGKRTVSISVGPWSTERLPLDTKVEVAR